MRANFVIDLIIAVILGWAIGTIMIHRVQVKELQGVTSHHYELIQELYAKHGIVQISRKERAVG